MTSMKMFGGYFSVAKRNESIDKTQIYVSAPTSNPIQVSIDGTGNVGLLALRATGTFPLDVVTDVLCVGQFQEKHSEMLVDSPGPAGFVIYVMSEGAECEVSINGMGKIILEVYHGDLNFQPPK